MNGEQLKPFVLLADDDEDTLALYALCAEARGWNYELARRPREIIAKVNEICVEGQRCFDLIVADINYWDNTTEEGVKSTGITVGRAIRKQFPNIPIVFVSAYVNALVREQVEAISVSEVIPKPVDIKPLFDRLECIYHLSKLKNTYEGLERRHISVNRSGQCRRATDRMVVIPTVIENALSQVRAEQKFAAGKERG